MSEPTADKLADDGPTPMGLYLLIIGVVLGILLGPGVLGQVAPRTYERLFSGGAEARAKLDALNAQATEKIARMEETGVTPEAIQELQLAQQAEQLPFRSAYDMQTRAHTQRLAALATGIVLLIVLLMIIETFAPLRALTLVRYGLAGAWLTLTLARPSMLTDIGVWF